MALYNSIQAGHKIFYLYNTVSDDFERVRFHGVKDSVIKLQAQALDLPLIQVKTRGDFYENDFKNGIRKTKEDILVFGDIHLQNCYNWARKISSELGFELSEPLWKKEPKAILKEFIDSGFEAVVVSCQSDLLDESFVGRKIDYQFLKEVSARSVDACGENGEYHTLVLNGPIFKRKLEIIKSKKVKIGNYWFLDVQECALKDN